MNSVYLWAQSLDNSSPDHIYVDGRVLNPQRYPDERERILSLISQVTINSQPQKVEENVQIYIKNNKLVLSIVLPEKDNLQRKAPILCYSSLTDLNDKLFSKRLVAYISKFIKSIGRSFPSSLEQEVVYALALAKKKLINTPTLILVLIAFFLSLLVLVFLYIYLIK